MVANVRTWLVRVVRAAPKITQIPTAVRHSSKLSPIGPTGGQVRQCESVLQRFQVCSYEFGLVPAGRG